MKKIVVLIFMSFCISCLVGCQNKETATNKVILEDQYYQEGGFLFLSAKKVDTLVKNKDSFVLFTYNNYCTMEISCEKVFESYMQEAKIRFVSIPFIDFKKTSLYDNVKYAPTVIIIQKGNIIAYLDANSDTDLEKYQNVEAFQEWFQSYVKVSH